MWLFMNLWKTVQSKCFTKPQEVHLEDLMSTDSLGSFLNKFSLNSSLIIMPVTIWWIGSVSWMISKQRNTENFCEGETTRIRLPDSLISKFLSQKCYDMNTAIQQHYNLDEIKILRNKYLCLEPKVMRQPLNPVLDDIISLLTNLLAKPELSRVKFACLVCGFPDSCLTGKKQGAFLPCLSHLNTALRIPCSCPRCCDVWNLTLSSSSQTGYILNRKRK